ncbi:MAG: type II toxin-antitoxin system Phd/YefM family antitoxin [Rhodospirillaceae bacterium]|nr:type II toxin-antitoxin system Phd/YefM family antitoxin [Rhodospirillaceae bacterium]
MRNIQLRDAKAKLSAVVDDALAGKPSVITRHGKRAAVIVGYDDWRRVSKFPSFGKLLMAMPVDAGDIPPRRRGALRTPNF